MSLYPNTILRCQHIKINGTQCGFALPARDKYCYYTSTTTGGNGKLWKQNGVSPDAATLEDANSIQMWLAKMIERLVLQEIDPKAAALVLYALQTASMNLKHTTLEPKLPTQVVIDRQSVARRPLGASAWSRVEGREYDDLTAESDDKSNSDAQKSSERYLQNQQPTASHPEEERE